MLKMKIDPTMCMKTKLARQNVMPKMQRFTRNCTHYTVIDDNRTDVLPEHARNGAINRGNAMDDGSRYGQGSFNIYDTKLDWGRSVYSRRHVWSTDLIYQLPYGKGKAWGNNLNPAVDAVLGGWQLSTILYAASGDFLDVTSETALANLGTQVWPRADQVKSGALSNRTTGEFFDTSAFVAPPPGRGGNSSRGVVQGPGSFTPDIAISKNFRAWKEGYRFQFRAEMYNAFNHASWGDPVRFSRARTSDRSLRSVTRGRCNLV
jgi:hypothetical protein